jgi:two-component system, NtrC family, sensor kinase
MPAPRVTLHVWMLAVLALVTGLAFWDERRESEAALQDFAAEQTTLAASIAANLSVRLAMVRRDAIIVAEGAGKDRPIPEAIAASYAPIRVRPKATPVTPLGPNSPTMLLSVPSGEQVVDVGVVPATLLRAASQVEHAGEVVVLVRPPRSGEFFTTDGRQVRSQPLLAALDAGSTSVRIERPEAAALGLPERMAFAGLATVNADRLGRWGIAAIATAHRVRDRQARAAWRLVLGLVVASSIVLAFGGIALRKQRRELVLERDLAIAAVENDSDQRLARAARAATMGTLAMGIAHEVSTPLGVIVGRAEQLLGRASGDERAERAARTIVEQADHIKMLVRRFLDLARGGRPALSRVDAASVARGAMSLVAHRFEKAGVMLDAEVPDKMPFIQCDRSLLEHALVNLLLNACEASKPGAKVTLTTASAGSPGGHPQTPVPTIAFAVTDEGSGISPEHASLVTEPFFTTKADGQGTGLGLTIATEIVKSHRGTLTLAPRSPRGTRAVIELPVSPEPPADDAKATGEVQDAL